MNFQCKGCSFAKKVTTNGGWSFTGCAFKPYQGKWIAEIKKCPKKQQEQQVNGNYAESRDDAIKAWNRGSTDE